jgi:hypothetical protein
MENLYSRSCINGRDASRYCVILYKEAKEAGPSQYENGDLAT